MAKNNNLQTEGGKEKTLTEEIKLNIHLHVHVCVHECGQNHVHARTYTRTHTQLEVQWTKVLWVGEVKELTQ